MVKNLSQVTSGRSRGRPVLPEAERKRARNISVSEPAWKGLEEQIKNLQIKTVSELIERIGLNQIQVMVLDASPLADIPIYRRLLSLISEPVAVFWSVLAFVARVCRQFTLEPTEERVCTITIKACAIAFYIGYTHPDLLINNASALLRWLCYRLLQAEMLLEQATVEPEVTTQQAVDCQKVDRHFYKIHNAFNALETAARSPDYKALKMKTIDGLTIKQISRIFKLQKLEVSKVEVSMMIKKGLANFRQLFGSSFSDYVPQLDVDSTQKSGVQRLAYRYLKLALQETLLDSQSQQSMEELLLKTSHDPYLDFWLNEIDYDLGGQNTAVRDRIAGMLEQFLMNKKTEIDPKLASCQTKEQIRQTLQICASKEAGTDLPIGLLLGEIPREK